MWQPDRRWNHHQVIVSIPGFVNDAAAQQPDAKFSPVLVGESTRLDISRCAATYSNALIRIVGSGRLAKHFCGVALQSGAILVVASRMCWALLGCTQIWQTYRLVASSSSNDLMRAAGGWHVGSHDGVRWPTVQRLCQVPGGRHVQQGSVPQPPYHPHALARACTHN
jgi:hypothetical protein